MTRCLRHTLKESGVSEWTDQRRQNRPRVDQRGDLEMDTEGMLSYSTNFYMLWFHNKELKIVKM